MEVGIEPENTQLLEALEKNYQIFLEAPSGEINVYLALTKKDEICTNKEQNKQSNSFNNSNITENTLNMLGGSS